MPRVRPGMPLRETDRERAAAVTDDDIVRAQRRFQKHAPTRWRQLLDAQPADEPESTNPQESP